MIFTIRKGSQYFWVEAESEKALREKLPKEIYYIVGECKNVEKIPNETLKVYTLEELLPKQEAREVL